MKKQKPIRSVGFAIKRPNKTRRTYAIIKDIRYLSGEREQVTLEDERLNAVNLNIQRGLINLEDAYASIKADLIPTLRKEHNIEEKKRLEDTISEANRKVYTAFWAERYEGRHLKNETSARNGLFAAIRAIEPLSLVTASKAEIRERLKEKTVKQQRRHIIPLNQLFKFLGRPIKLDKPPKPYQEVDYVTWEELQKILPHIHSIEVRHLAIALWGTGVRIGEAFAPGFTRFNAQNKTIYISQQLCLKKNEKDEWVIGEVKNCKPHQTMLIPQAEEGYLAWCAVENKERFRVSAINQIIRASKKAFPKTKAKQVSAHDLRHSYAIHLAGLGATESQIAKVLGDTIATVLLHYTGFIMTDAMVANLAALMPKKP